MPSPRRLRRHELLALAALLPAVARAGSCVSLNYCSGHGTCNDATSTCACFVGYGAPSDIMSVRAPDCSFAACPSGAAWFDVATGAYTAHAPAECSNQGLCDPTTGRCRCFAGYEGEACQRCEWGILITWPAIIWCPR